jgi:hypothetical protein
MTGNQATISTTSGTRVTTSSKIGLLDHLRRLNLTCFGIVESIQPGVPPRLCLRRNTCLDSYLYGVNTSPVSFRPTNYKGSNRRDISKAVSEASKSAETAEYFYCRLRQNGEYRSDSPWRLRITAGRGSIQDFLKGRCAATQQRTRTRNL